MFTRNYKESFVSMASVTPASSSTKETTNYARLCYRQQGKENVAVHDQNKKQNYLKLV